LRLCQIATASDLDHPVERRTPISALETCARRGGRVGAVDGGYRRWPVWISYSHANTQYHNPVNHLQLHLDAGPPGGRRRPAVRRARTAGSGLRRVRAPAGGAPRGRGDTMGAHARGS